MIRAWLIDAFARRQFGGGPAYVVEAFDEWPSTAWMQNLAGELAQPETAFLRRTGDPSRYGIRWFTPLAEAPLCGHATLAAAHALVRESGEVEPGATVSFDCAGGVLTARSEHDLYLLELPADPPHRIAAPAGLAAVLGTGPHETWAGRQYLCAVLADEASVRDLMADPAELGRIANDEGFEKGSLVVAALADPGRPYDVVSRFFAPLVGIPEDPVTGSAHCMLMPLFAMKLGRTSLDFHQAHPLRGGDLACEVRGDRVLLRGAALTVADVHLRIEPEDASATRCGEGAS